jgi:hypothetical protein
MKKTITILCIIVAAIVMLFGGAIYLTLHTNIFVIDQSEYEPSSVSVKQSEKRNRFICEYMFYPNKIHITGVGSFDIISSWYEYNSPLGLNREDNEILIRFEGNRQEEQALLDKNVEMKMNSIKLKNAITIGTSSRFILLIDESLSKLAEKDTFYVEFWLDGYFSDSICFVKKK